MNRSSSLVALEKLEARKDARKPALKSEASLKGFKDKTAFSLLQREEQNAKKSRLESLLTQQFIGKYGTKQPSSSINNFIKSTVTDFVYAYENVKVAETMIESLESQIREITANMRNKIVTSRQEKQQSSDSGNVGNNARRGSKQDGSNPSSYSQSGAKQPTDVDPSWALLNAVLAQEAEDKERSKRELSEAAKIKFRTELDKQRASVQQRQAVIEAEKVSAFEMVKRAKDSHEADQLRIREKKEKIFVVERELRLKQIADNQLIREKEKQLKIMQEKMDMARSRRLAEEEQELIRLKKDEQKKAQDQLVVENEHNKAIKAEALKQQWLYEAKLNKDYEEKMAREEKGRQDAFQARIDALKRAEKGFSHIAGARAQAEAFNQQKVMEEIEKKYKADADKEVAKKEQQRVNIETSRAFNLTLIERKQKIKDEERQRDIDMRKKIESENALAQEKERQKIEEKRQRMHDLKCKLDEQVNFHNKQGTFTKGAGLSQLELDMNKTIIKKIESDPALFHKVMERVHPVHTKGSTGPKFI